MQQSYDMEKRFGEWVIYVNGVAQLCCQRKRTAMLAIKDANELLGRYLAEAEETQLKREDNLDTERSARCPTARSVYHSAAVLSDAYVR